MNKPLVGRSVLIARIVVALLFGVLLFLSHALYVNYRHIAYVENSHGRRIQFLDLRKNRAMTGADASSIEPWMTFEYINKVFKIDPAYLKTELNLSDKKYPKLSLSKYARNHGQNIETLVERVSESVRRYLLETNMQVKR